MLPDPLHPAVVHFPIALVVLLPVVALTTLFFMRGRAGRRRLWIIPVAVAAALTLSAWVAVETGEDQEERVEEVVGETALHTHEEAAERFLQLSGVLLLVAGAGLLGGVVGTSTRVLATVGSLGLVAAGLQVGGSGGELVYRHGAASAYVQEGAQASAADGAAAGEAVVRERDD